MPSDPAGTAACEHDWRVNPFAILPVNPPAFQVRCARCPAVEARRSAAFGVVADPEDVTTWPKA